MSRQPKKVLMVSPYFYPDGGGLENYVYNISKGLVKKGIKVTVFCSTKKRKDSTETIDGIKVIRQKPDFILSNTPVALRWRNELLKAIKNERPDVINGHFPVPFIADIAARVAREEKIPFVLTYQNDLMKESLPLNFLCKLYYGFLGNTTLDISDRLISTSKYYAKRSPYLSQHMAKVEIIPPGVDLARFNPKLNRNYLSRKCNLKNSKIVLFVGQLDRSHTHKGLDYLIEAIKIARMDINNLKLVVVGAGDHVAHYKETAKKLGIEDAVIFAGYVPDKELPLYYRGSDVTVLPSYLDTEGFGMTLIEAGACGRPVIGTKVGGIPAVIKDGETGLLVPPKDSEALAGGIVKVLDDERFAKSLGQNARRFVEDNFDWRESIKKTLCIYVKNIS